MVFGIGEGKIDIILDKFNFSQGETIRGKVKLELNQPKKAKELRIELKALRRISRRHISTGGHTRSDSKDEVVYSFVLVLDKEKDYTSNEYNFEIGIPKTGSATAPPTGEGGLLGELLSRAVAQNPVRWYLEASLNLPMSLDINKTIQINVV